MQVIFIVIPNDNISSPNTKVFNYEAQAKQYQFELKRAEFKNVTVYEKEVIE